MEHLLKIISSRIPANEECARLFHGRGKKWQEFSYLSIDLYPPFVLITTYKEIDDVFKEDLVKLLCSISQLRFDSIILQKRHLKQDNVEMLLGEMPAEAFAVEKAEKYLLNLKSPQNTGFFLDMGEGREWLRKNSRGKKVLNLFSYTCSLSVAALKGGATSVTNIDMSLPSLKIGQRNHDINGLGNDNRSLKFFHYDIMKSMGTIGKKGPYDLVIIDPPTNQGESFKVERDYHKIIRRLPEMAAPECIVMACLNSPYHGSDFLIDSFKEFAPMFSFEEKKYSSLSSMEANPEEGLKMLYFKKSSV